MKTAGAAAYDVFCNEAIILKPGETKIIKLGFALEIPEGYYMEIRGRSGLSSKGYTVATGTIDADYRGEIGVIMTNTSPEKVTFDQGDRVGQMQLKEVIGFSFCEVAELTDTDRGAGGFGSTGIK